MLMPVNRGGSPTKKASQLLRVAKAAAKNGANVERALIKPPGG